MSVGPRSTLVLLACLHGALGCRLEREAIAPQLDADGANDQQPGARRDDDDAVAGAAGSIGGNEVPSFADAGLTGFGVEARVDAATPVEAAVEEGLTNAGAEASECTAPAVAVCDPMTNTGCPAELQMQCAVDLAAPVLSGYCTFGVPADPALCVNTPWTESCPPASTCVGGACRRLCFCDAHCDGGQCCGEPVGNLGFKVCGAC